MVIQTEGLSFNFGSQTVVNSLSLQVPQGSIYGFLGPNGAGKTTTIKLLLNLLQTQEGSIQLFGLDFKANRKEILSQVGSLIEQPAIYAHLTGRENLMNRAILLQVNEKRVDEMLTLVRLSGAAEKTIAPAIAHKLLTDASLTQCTIYFKYYLHQALIQAGLGNDYMKWLDIWREDIKLGLTTWAEMSDVPASRSDCHAWGSSPNIEFFRTVLGIDSYAPGFRKIRIEPHLGDLKNASGEIPHPNGKISVSYILTQKAFYVKVNLPPGTSGVFIWKGVEKPLVAGDNGFIF